MTKLGIEISDSTMAQLERRVAKLMALLEIATHKAADKKIRENGAQLSDRLAEWIDDIKDLREAGDEEVAERISSFTLRLKMAEDKMKNWPIPAAAREELNGGRRRRTRKVRPAA
jgi:hypothetical protein